MATTNKYLVKWSLPIPMKHSDTDKRTDKRFVDLEKWVIEEFKRKIGYGLFREYRDGDRNYPHVEFAQEQSQCFVGRDTSRIKQWLFYKVAGRDDDRIKKTLVHELGHCLGLEHELYHPMFPFDFSKLEQYRLSRAREFGSNTLERLSDRQKKMENPGTGRLTAKTLDDLKPRRSQKNELEPKAPSVTTDPNRLFYDRVLGGEDGMHYSTHMERAVDARQNCRALTDYCDVSSVMLYKPFQAAIRTVYKTRRPWPSKVHDGGIEDQTILSQGDISGLRSLYETELWMADITNRTMEDIESRTGAAAARVAQAIAPFSR